MRKQSPQQSLRAKLFSWSSTKLLDVTACPLWGFFKYFLQVPVAESPHAVFGQAMHYLFMLFMRPHPKTKRFPYEDLERFLGIWWSFWWSAVVGSLKESKASPIALLPYQDWIDRKRAKKPSFKPPKEHGFDGWTKEPTNVAWKNDEQPTMFYKWGVKILTQFYRRFSEERKDGTPRLLERRFRFFYKGLEHLGKVDRIDILPDRAVLIDYKLNPLPSDQIIRDFQMIFYDFAYLHYFRPRIEGSPPLKEIKIFVYGNEGDYQEIPIYPVREFNKLQLHLLQAHFYFQGVLTGLLPPAQLLDKLDWYNWNDMLTGEITPRLPIQKHLHCRFCRYPDLCKQKEDGLLPTAREMFDQKYQKELENYQPGQLWIPFPDRPIVRDTAIEASYLRHKVYPSPQRFDFT